MINLDIIKNKIIPLLDRKTNCKLRLFNKDYSESPFYNEIIKIKCDSVKEWQLIQIKKYFRSIKIIINYEDTNKYNLYNFFDNMINIELEMCPESFGDNSKKEISKTKEEKHLKYLNNLIENSTILHKLTLKNIAEDKIIESLKINKSIRILELDYDEYNNKYINDFIKYNKTIKILKINFKFVSSYKKFLDGLIDNNTLETLVINHDHCRRSGDYYCDNYCELFENLIDVLKFNKTLKNIYLPNIEHYGSCDENDLHRKNSIYIKYICDILKNSNSLQTLNFKHTMYIGYPGYIGLNFNYDKKRQTLDLQYTNMDYYYDKYEYVIQTFKNRLLKILDLKNCDMFKYSYELIEGHPEIEHIELDRNLYIECVSKTLINLRILYLDFCDRNKYCLHTGKTTNKNNNISNTVATLLKNNNKIEKLTIKCYNYNDNVIKNLYDGLEKNQALKEMELYVNLENNQELDYLIKILKKYTLRILVINGKYIDLYNKDIYDLDFISGQIKIAKVYNHHTNILLFDI